MIVHIPLRSDGSLTNAGLTAVGLAKIVDDDQVTTQLATAVTAWWRSPTPTV